MNRPERVVAGDVGSRRRNQLGQAMGAKGARTRARLLEATETLLNTTPLRELRVAQIVRLTGASAATFYVYFNDVQEAVLALVGELSQSPPAILARVAEPWRGEGALDRAHEFIDAYMEHWQKHSAVFRVRNLASDEGDERFTQLRLGAISPLLDAIAHQIAARRAAGGLPADLHPASSAGALLALIERMPIVPLVSNGSGVTRARLMGVAAFFAVLLLGEGWDVTLQPMERRARRGRDKAALPPSLTTSTGTPRAAPVVVNLHGQAMGAKGVRTRQRIVEATRALLQSRSLLELSVAEIAKAAKISTSTFYLYFQDVPEALLAAVEGVSHSTPELLALLEGDWNEEDRDARAYAFVCGYIEHWRANRAVFRPRDLVADEGDERFISARSAAIAPLLDVLSRHIAERQALGGLPADLHPPSAAGALLAMIDRLAVTPNLVRHDVGLETVSRAAAYFLSVLMHGYPL